MSTLRVRFTFNRQSGKSGFVAGNTKGTENFANTIVRDVAFSYSDGLYRRLQASIRKKIKHDVERELQRTASMFMHGVIGVPGRSRGPRGTLTAVAPRADNFTENLSVPVRFLVPSWPRRSPAYLQSRGGNPPWFHKNGHVLAPLANADTWTHAFGPIAVEVSRHTSIGPRDPAARGFNTRLTGIRAGNAKVGVAHIRVRAMNRITADMLPALAGHPLNDYGAAPRKSGLLNLLGGPMAWRLGGDPNHVPFRPTIQPFLGFFLTRQLPNAVAKRIEQGMQGQLRENIGSAGRTTAKTGATQLDLSDYRPRR